MIRTIPAGLQIRCDRCGKRSSSTNEAGRGSGDINDTVFGGRGWTDIPGLANWHRCPGCTAIVAALGATA